MPTAPGIASERVDKWLWTVRIFKTRGLATEACRAGNVDVGGKTAKPAREVCAGDTVTVRQGVVTRTLMVVGLPPRRIGAKVAASFCEDRTPPEEFARAQERPVQQFLARSKGLGRPTKRERRAIDRLFG